MNQNEKASAAAPFSLNYLFDFADSFCPHDAVLLHLLQNLHVLRVPVDFSV